MRTTPSLRGDVVFIMKNVPRASTEMKMQAILDARMPGAIVCIWPSRRGNVTGRLSVPRDVVEVSPEFKVICSTEQGSWFFIGPHKVFLELERSNVSSRKVRKVTRVSRLEEQLGTLVSVVQSLKFPTAPLVESRQQSLDILSVLPNNSASLPPKAPLFSVRSSPNKKKSNPKKQRKQRKKRRHLKPVEENLMELEDDLSEKVQRKLEASLERLEKNLSSRLVTVAIHDVT